MRRASPIRQRLAALGLLGVPALTWPLIGLPEGVVFGLPAGWLYLFGIWAGLIGAAALITGRRRK